MYQRKRRKMVAEMNMVPFIDVMMCLLLIFMATAPLIKQGVEIDLPQSVAKALPEESRSPLVASLDQHGFYYVNVAENEDEPLGAADLAAIVRYQLSVTPDIPVMVRADKRANWEQVMRLMAVLQRAGAPSVGLMSDPVAR